MRVRSILAVSLFAIVLSSCAENVSNESVKNTSIGTEPASNSEALDLIKLSEVKVDFNNCLLMLQTTDMTKHFDVEIINFKRVSSFKTRTIEENSQQYHIVYFDDKAVAMVNEEKRTMVEYNFTNCVHRM